MRASHREIRKRIMDAKSKISDEEFFTSKAYRGYLTDITEAATKRYHRPLHVTVVADHDDSTVSHRYVLCDEGCCKESGRPICGVSSQE